jgi:hypothetical protein
VLQLLSHGCFLLCDLVAISAFQPEAVGRSHLELFRNCCDKPEARTQLACRCFAAHRQPCSDRAKLESLVCFCCAVLCCSCWLLGVAAVAVVVVAAACVARVCLSCVVFLAVLSVAAFFPFNNILRCPPRALTSFSLTVCMEFNGCTTVRCQTPKKN